MKFDNDFYLRLDDHIRCIFNRFIPWVVVFIAIALLNAAAHASGRDHGDTVNIHNTYIKDDRFMEGLGKGAAAVIGTQCVAWPATKAYLWPATVGLFTWRRPQWKRWENCWEGSK